MGEWAKRVGLGVVLVAVALSYWWVPLSLRHLQFFGVRRIAVSGTRYLSADDVVRGLSLDSTANVFDDRHALERRLESLGGIEQARVTRKLPATLVVVVTEVEPVALAEGPDGLVALAKDARPLPYDLVAAPVDAPIVRDAGHALLEALAQVQATDPGLYTDVASARAGTGEMVLELARGRMRLRMPVDVDVVRSLSTVRRDLESRGTEWLELDGRYRGWIVVRRAQPAASSRPAVKPSSRRRGRR